MKKHMNMVLSLCLMAGIAGCAQNAPAGEQNTADTETAAQ